MQNVDKDIDQALKILNFVSADKKTRADLIHLEESRRDTDSERINAERLAEERGRTEERKKNARIIAKKFGISVEEAEDLLK